MLEEYEFISKSVFTPQILIYRITPEFVNLLKQYKFNKKTEFLKKSYIEAVHEESELVKDWDAAIHDLK